ncbi:FAD-dependent thymidylate synthase [Enterobacter asburiae]|uniref:FAD-dependent thymidylate synthase n=1 Tax=Enterobacter asburiae TaxID=61645 RepID=UPI00192AD3C4|nr:FAD-dependent thymidylate synthase [Enterobacter asburiae]MBL5840923.1 FAD-dependent thymidylate synthase [Enterobacter asburiae]
MTEAVIARVVADSISPQGQRITTFELEYPRIIHSELMTHRLFSRNAMSSRAIPIKKMIQQALDNPAMPVKFGKNQPGMQDAGDHSAGIGKRGYSPEQWWKFAAAEACHFASGFDEAGYHKQIANRLLEPFQRMKTVLTATDFENFWWLRVDKDADPTIFALAEAMKKAFDESLPELLEPGQWHTPYVDHVYEYEDIDDKECVVFVGYCVLDENDKPVMLTVEEAKAISASCCAQVSYRVLNNTKDKALDIYGKLLSGNKVHASPFEHQATPMKGEFSQYGYDPSVNLPGYAVSWEEGITHVDRNGALWSGNFCGWVQHRQLVPNNVVSG